jgi:hypothetical protein
MSVTTASPDRARVRRLAILAFGLELAVAGLFTVAALGATGDTEAMFWLLVGFAGAGAIAALATVAAARAGGRVWVATAVGALVASVALLVLAATKDVGPLLLLTMLPVLLLDWWLLKGLRETALR